MGKSPFFLLVTSRIHLPSIFTTTTCHHVALNSPPWFPPHWAFHVTMVSFRFFIPNQVTTCLKCFSWDLHWSTWPSMIRFSNLLTSWTLLCNPDSFSFHVPSQGLCTCSCCFEGWVLPPPCQPRSPPSHFHFLREDSLDCLYRLCVPICFLYPSHFPFILDGNRSLVFPNTLQAL